MEFVSIMLNSGMVNLERVWDELKVKWVSCIAPRIKDGPSPAIISTLIFTKFAFYPFFFPFFWCFALTKLTTAM